MNKKNSHILFKMILLIYKLLSIICTPILKCFLLYRCAQCLEDRTRLQERYGKPTLAQPKTTQRVIWFHAASMGETLSIKEFLHQWHELCEDDYLLLTTTTKTAADTVAKQFPNFVNHQYIPLDSVIWVKRFLTYWNPCKIYFVESEIWPNFLSEIKKMHSQPELILLNARISDQSYTKWSKVPVIAKPLFQFFDRTYAQNKESFDRLNKLGASQIKFYGNLKLGSKPLIVDDKLFELLTKIRQRRPMLTLASTHENEEALLISSFYHNNILTKKDVDLPDSSVKTPSQSSILLCIVPRHIQRSSSIKEYIDSHFPLKCMLLSDISQSAQEFPNIDVLIVDGMGLLGAIYKASSIVVMGGSFIPHGGQNPIEAIFMKKPVFYGPYMHNFKDICSLCNAHGALVAHSPQHAAEITAKWLAFPDEADTIGESLFNAVQNEQQVLFKILKAECC